MPIPHEVTKDFFVPMDDFPLFEENTESNNEQIANRINDLMQLFNLLDAAFRRNNNDTNNDNNNNNENSNTENTETNKSSETSNEPANENTENSNSHFNFPNLNRIREEVL